MDKIWYRNPSKSEVIGRCGGDLKTEWPRRADKKSNAKNKKNNNAILMIMIMTQIPVDIKYCIVVFDLVAVPLIMIFTGKTLLTLLVASATL